MHIIKYDEQEYEYVKTTSQNICDQFRPDEMRRADRQTVTCLLLTNQNRENGISRSDKLDTKGESSVA